VGVGKERRGRGQGAVPHELTPHGPGGSGPLGQRRAAHIARARWTRANRGGGLVGHDDAGPGGQRLGARGRGSAARC
jgi:hypothetical protein